MLDNAVHARNRKQSTVWSARKEELKRLFYFGYSLSKKGACKMPARKIISLRVGM